MKTTRARFARLLITACALLIMGGADVMAQAIRGTIINKNDGRITGDLLWQEGSRQYLVTRRGVAVPVALRDVKRVIVARPAELTAAAREVHVGHVGRVDKAIPVLKKIMQKYRMMEHDLEAAAWLAEAYLKKKDAREAKRLCESVIRADPDRAYRGRLAGVYADALLALKEFSKLRKVLDKVVKTGSRQGTAIAQVKRGDIYKQQGNTEKALVDGYLRTVVLFKAIKGIRPEALFKAAKAFEELGEQQYAERMRKLLLEEFPNDKYAAKIKLAM